MPLDRFEIRVSLEKLLLVLIVILVPLNFIGLYLTMDAHTAVEQKVGTLFRDIAHSDAIATRAFIDDRVTDVGTIATQPAVVDAIVAANRATGQVSEAARAAKITDIEKQWDTAASDSLVSGVLGSRASISLRRQRQLDPREPNTP